MYRMTTFQKSYILTKFWVWEKCPNIGWCVKSVAQGLGVGKTLSDSSLYVFSENNKKTPHIHSMSGLTYNFIFCHWTTKSKYVECSSI